MPPGRDSFRRNRVAPTTPSFYHPALLSVHQVSQPILSQWSYPEQDVYTPRPSHSSNHPNPSDLTLLSTRFLGSSPPKPMGPQELDEVFARYLAAPGRVATERGPTPR